MLHSLINNMVKKIKGRDDMQIVLLVDSFEEDNNDCVYDVSTLIEKFHHF